MYIIRFCPNAENNQMKTVKVTLTNFWVIFTEGWPDMEVQTEDFPTAQKHLIKIAGTVSSLGNVCVEERITGNSNSIYEPKQHL